MWALYLHRTPSPPSSLPTASEASCTKKYMYSKTKIENQHRRVDVGYKYTKSSADVVTQCKLQIETESSWEPRKRQAMTTLPQTCPTVCLVGKGFRGRMDLRKRSHITRSWSFLSPLGLVKVRKSPAANTAVYLCLTQHGPNSLVAPDPLHDISAPPVFHGARFGICGPSDISAS